MNERRSIIHKKSEAETLLLIEDKEAAQNLIANLSSLADTVKIKILPLFKEREAVMTLPTGAKRSLIPASHETISSIQSNYQKNWENLPLSELKKIAVPPKILHALKIMGIGDKTMEFLHSLGKKTPPQIISYYSQIPLEFYTDLRNLISALGSIIR